MLKELFNAIVGESAESRRISQTGQIVDLGGPSWLKHYINGAGDIESHVCEPDDFEHVFSNIVGLVDYLVAIGKRNEQTKIDISEGGGNGPPINTVDKFDLNNVDVCVCEKVIECCLNRDSRRGRIDVKFQFTTAARIVATLSSFNGQSTEGRVFRQNELVRFLRVDLKDYLSQKTIEKFESIRWSSTDVEHGTVMRDKSSMGREIDAIAESRNSGNDAGSLPEEITFSIPVYDDPFFLAPENFASVVIQVLPNVGDRSIELIVAPDDIQRSIDYSLDLIVSFVRSQIAAHVGETTARIVRA